MILLFFLIPVTFLFLICYFCLAYLCSQVASVPSPFFPSFYVGLREEVIPDLSQFLYLSFERVCTACGNCAAFARSLLAMQFFAKALACCLLEAMITSRSIRLDALWPLVFSSRSSCSGRGLWQWWVKVWLVVRLFMGALRAFEFRCSYSKFLVFAVFERDPNFIVVAESSSLLSSHSLSVYFNKVVLPIQPWNTCLCVFVISLIFHDLKAFK